VRKEKFLKKEKEKQQQRDVIKNSENFFFPKKEIQFQFN
jgi:hypothetical protein